MVASGWSDGHLSQVSSDTIAVCGVLGVMSEISDVQFVV